MQRFLVVTVMMITVACSPKEPAVNMAVADAEARAAIHAANALGVTAMNAGDLPAFLAINAEDVTSMSPDGKSIVGKAALEASMRADMATDTNRATVSWSADTIEVHGDYAYEVGRGTGIRGTDTSRTQYITFWRKSMDGKWRATRDFTVRIRPTP